MEEETHEVSKFSSFSLYLRHRALSLPLSVGHIFLVTYCIYWYIMEGGYTEVWIPGKEDLGMGRAGRVAYTVCRGRNHLFCFCCFFFEFLNLWESASGFEQVGWGGHQGGACGCSKQSSPGQSETISVNSLSEIASVIVMEFWELSSCHWCVTGFPSGEQSFRIPTYNCYM